MTTEELLEKAYAGDKAAQTKIIHKLIKEPDYVIIKVKLKEFSDLGWKSARLHYIYGLIDGKYEIEKDLVELKRLADLDCLLAQCYYCNGLAEGRFGIKQNPVELKELAYLGWKEAQEFYCEGLCDGWYGIERNDDLAEELKKLWNLND